MLRPMSARSKPFQADRRLPRKQKNAAPTSPSNQWERRRTATQNELLLLHDHVERRTLNTSKAHVRRVHGQRNLPQRVIRVVRQT